MWDAQFLTDCFDRFNHWTEIVGVFQKGEASLDARLADRVIVDTLMKALKELEFCISELEAIADGKRAQWTWNRATLQIAADEYSDSDDWSDSDVSDSIDNGVSVSIDSDVSDSIDSEVSVSIDSDDSDLIDSDVSDWIDNESDMTLSSAAEKNYLDEETTESKELRLTIHACFTLLLKLSVCVQRALERSKFAKSSVFQYYTIWSDVNHVRDFFPHAAHNETLVKRLGNANAERRQWLAYRQLHRKILFLDRSGPREQRFPVPRGTQSSNGEPVTLFSTDEHVPASILVSLSKAWKIASDAFALLTGEASIFVPNPPHYLVLGMPFFCQYCCSVIKISGRNAWEKHVHSDLSSYICVFSCWDDRLFESRREWLAHVMEVHFGQWLCRISHPPLASISTIEEDLRVGRQDRIPSEHPEDIAPSYGRPRVYINAKLCPLCDYVPPLRQRGRSDEQRFKLSPENFARHVCRHLEQLALSVLSDEDLIEVDEDLGDDGDDETNSEGDLGPTEHPFPELDLVQRLVEEASGESCSPEVFTAPPDLAMRWQPPQDFNPPLEDFDTEDADFLPARPEPIFGGDLYTPGWVRGIGENREGFCARCPVAHWVDLFDGSYRFHLTYFHGIPDSGVPLPRPSAIRPVAGKSGVWEGFCDTCEKWKTLKKTKRGWNWYRHWLDDHTKLVESRMEAVRYGGCPEGANLVKPRRLIDSPSKVVGETPLTPRLIPYEDEELAENDRVPFEQLAQLAIDDKPEDMEVLLEYLVDVHTRQYMLVLVNSRFQSGNTLLMFSAANGLRKVVTILLELGADPNASRTDGKTALDLAADAGYFTIAQQLICSGADPSLSNTFKAVFSNEREYAGEMTRTLEPVTSASKIDRTALTPLGKAAANGDAGEVTTLLGSMKGAQPDSDIEEGFESGSFPLSLASDGTQFAVLKPLSNDGGNINTTSKNGWTPLMLATKGGDKQWISFLLSHGAEVNHVSPDRWTALAEATSNGHTDIMRLLLEAGADTEIRARSDWTPLMLAAYRGDIEAVNILLDAGASFEEISARDESVMLLAAASGSAILVKKLLDMGCPPEPLWSTTTIPAITRATDGQGKVTTTRVLDQQERIERMYRIGWILLMVACQIGNLEMVNMLLDAGANAKPRSPFFKTALEIARENGWAAVADHLVKRVGTE